MSASTKKVQGKQVQKKKKVMKNKQVVKPKKNYKQQQKPQTTLRIVKPPQETIANGVRKNIMVYCDLEKLAVECIPVGILSRALSQGFQNDVINQVYWAYVAFMQDVISLMSSQVSNVFGRLDYLNRIMASIQPKSVDGLKNKAISYSWRNTSTVTVQNPALSIRGKNVYWYVPGNTVDGVWLLQNPPSNPSTEEIANTTLALLYDVIAADAGTNPNLEFQVNINMKDDYKRDVSSFAGVAPYYGQSSGDSSCTFGSAESEVPYLSQILSCLTTYKAGGDRVARFFHPTSGGSIEAFSLGLYPEMRKEYYNTVYPINYKYLDFDEVYVFLTEWYSALTSKAAYDFKNGSLPNDNLLVQAMTPFPFTAQQFAVALRQSILSRFVCQSTVQASTYSSDAYGFEAFRCGSNTYCRQYDYTLAIPTVLNENLNALLPRFFEVTTKYASKKNAYISLPVWGTYKSWVATNPNMEVLEPIYNTINSAPMFQPAVVSDPNIWDGTNTSSNVCDFNRSPIVQEIFKEWNSRIMALMQYASTVTYMGGESSGALLLHTRYADYPPQPRRYMDTIFPMTRASIPSHCVEQEVVETPRTNSKSKIEIPPKTRDVYVPKDGSLLTQKTTAYASTSKISAAEKTIYSYLILPTIVTEEGSPPYQRQSRVAYIEPYVLDLTKDDISVGGRYMQLKTLAGMCATGTAGSQNSELSQVVDYLTRKGQGGFIGDVLSVLAKEIPI